MTSAWSSELSVNGLETSRLADRSMADGEIPAGEPRGQSAEVTMRRQIAFYNIMAINYQRMKTLHETAEKRLRLIESENDNFKRVTRCLSRNVQELNGSGSEQSPDDGKDYFEALEKCGRILTDKLLEYKKRADEVGEQLERDEATLARCVEEETRLKTHFKALWTSCLAERRGRDAYETGLRDNGERLSSELNEALINVRDERQAFEQLNAATQEMAFGYGTYVRDTMTRTKRLYGHNVRLAAVLKESRATERELRAKLRLVDGRSGSRGPEDSSKTTFSGCDTDDVFVVHG